MFCVFASVFWSSLVLSPGTTNQRIQMIHLLIRTSRIDSTVSTTQWLTSCWRDTARCPNWIRQRTEPSAHCTWEIWARRSRNKIWGIHWSFVMWHRIANPHARHSRNNGTKMTVLTWCVVQGRDLLPVTPTRFQKLNCTWHVVFVQHVVNSVVSFFSAFLQRSGEEKWLF